MNHARKGLDEALQVIVEHVPSPDEEERLSRAYELVLRAAGAGDAAALDDDEECSKPSDQTTIEEQL